MGPLFLNQTWIIEYRMTSTSPSTNCCLIYFLQVGGAQDHQVCFCDDIDRCNRAGRDLAGTLTFLLLSLSVYMFL